MERAVVREDVAAADESGAAAAFDVDVGPIQLLFGIAVMLAVAALPLAIAGIGTGQVVFVTVFSGLARDAELLAMSIVLTTSIIVARSILGFFFAPEFTREAIAVPRESEGSA